MAGDSLQLQGAEKEVLRPVNGRVTMGEGVWLRGRGSAGSALWYCTSGIVL